AHDRAADALIGRRWRYRVDEALARSADQEGEAEQFELAKPRDRDDALLWRLAETDAGVEHDHVARNAGAFRDVERTGEKRRDVGHDVDRRIGGRAILHHDDRHPVLADDPRHIRLAPQTPFAIHRPSPYSHHPP